MTKNTEIMKLDAATYHDIINLTTNVAVSPAEAETWKKCLLATADEKMKMQRSQLTVNLLRKLQKRGMGVNEVEFFAKKSSGVGPRKEERRRRTVQLIMKGKLEDALLVLRWSKERFRSKLSKVDRRWGHERATMTAFRTILTREAERVWKDGKDKNKKKLEHLERKWRNNPRTEVEGVWRGVKIGNNELEEEMAAEEAKAPQKYGGVVSNADEDALLALPHKWRTSKWIKSKYPLRL